MHSVRNAFLMLPSLFAAIAGQSEGVNRPPQFVPGSGDMSRFSLSESTTVGSPVYQLKGTDPDGSTLHYSISGPVFSVDRDTGVVRLRQQLDRETQNLVEVIISITDEGIFGTEPNTISLRREIPIRDYNDNAPAFQGRPYAVSLSESTPVGSDIIVEPQVIVTDRDEGPNAEIVLSCFDDPAQPDPEVCKTFTVHTERLGDGKYAARLTLRKALDFESRKSYLLTLLASDQAQSNPLKTQASIAIDVIDVQDQAPVFLNAPYVITMAENTAADIALLNVAAKDGDTGNPRAIVLTLDDEPKGHFRLEPIGPMGRGRATLKTTSVPIDREDPDLNGGLYRFKVRATELIAGQPTGDHSTTEVIVFVTDVDDHAPVFNETQFDIVVPENLELGWWLPNLAIDVWDQDKGDNARYDLSLRNVQNAQGVFAVRPTSGQDRTLIAVEVIDPTRLDYDVDDEKLRVISFEIVSWANGIELSKSLVNVHLKDVNDNLPVFQQESYRVSVAENATIGTKIAEIRATDKDSGKFGEIKYYLKGYGTDQFGVDEQTGNLFVHRSLDYEHHQSYSLTMLALDGGMLESYANIVVEIIDINDNYPVFQSNEFTRTVREGTTEFIPELIVRATDLDGPTQGGGRMRYSIESENSISGRVFGIDADSGEIQIHSALTATDTERGQYELVIKATDYGTPPLSNTTRVQVRVGISGNQRPIFRGHFSTIGKGDIPGPPRFTVTIPETAPAGYNVTTVSATDPDGPDSLIKYTIIGPADDFDIDEKSGLIQISTVARLDRDDNPDQYAVVIHAIDSGDPIPETATATLYVNVKDENNKPPIFDEILYTAFISERAGIGADVLTVHATDTDSDARLQYSIVEATRAISSFGLPLQPNASNYKYQSAFQMNPSSGEITVQNPLSHEQASIITLSVKVIDLQAAYNIDKQHDLTEVIIYVQKYIETNPVFSHKDWTSRKPMLQFTIKEEMPIGSTVFQLEAEDPVAHLPIQNYELTIPDRAGFFTVQARTGEVILNRRLDYEKLNNTLIEFTVVARTNDGRSTSTFVRVTVENVNDNSPEFEQKLYTATVTEGKTYPTNVVTVYASDADIVLNELDKRVGYNAVIYSLSHTEQYDHLFVINNRTGLIQIAPNRTVDYEQQKKIRLTVIAEDSPGRLTEKRTASADVIITVLDINDNAPTFSRESYLAVVTEDASGGISVANLTANDPDEGPGGEIRYELLNEGDASGLLRINRSTGEIKTRVALTGKGRAEPFELVIRARDHGDQVPKQTSLHSDVPFTLYIGDVNSNDGMPYFVSPEYGDSVTVLENATIGTPVIKVIAKDIDSPLTPAGQLSYKIQMDIDDANYFTIDEDSGLIRTLKTFDRETKDSYHFIVVVSDNGDPKYVASKVIEIDVLDVDDHEPHFKRHLTSLPLKMTISEEEPIGTVVGNLTAFDEDVGENADIAYAIINGNDDASFTIERNSQNTAIIRTHKRLDREAVEEFTLTIKCYKLIPDDRSSIVPTDTPYNREDLSLILVHIVVLDIDDHLPQFTNRAPVIGVRANVRVDELLYRVHASDADPEALPIEYTLVHIAFVPQYYRRDNDTMDGNLTTVFQLDRDGGAIRTAMPLSQFVDGYFEMVVRANNSASPRRHSDCRLKIFVIREKSLLRFVFTKPVTGVAATIGEFGERIRRELNGTELEMYILNTNVLMGADRSLDYMATSACFQLSRHGAALSPDDMQTVMDSADVRNRLLDTYAKYSVSVVDSCAVPQTVEEAKFIWTPGVWMVIVSTLIGVAALAATITACCQARKYKEQTEMLIQSQPPPPPSNEIYDTSNAVHYAEPIYGPV